MKAVVCLERDKISIEEITLDPPQAGQVRVRMVATGVCHSDLSVVNGAMPLPLPIVLGHEGAGVVEEVAEGVSNVKVGDHVILTFVPNCGDCFHCLRNEAFLCVGLAGSRGRKPAHMGDTPLGVMTHLGNMAEEVVCPSISVVPIDKDISLRLAALVGCGVTTGVGAAINTAKVTPGSTVAVFGCGGVGLSAIQGARLAGAERIFAVDMADNKLEMASRFGATDVVNASKEPVDQIKDATGGIGVDYAFEAIGNPAVVQQAFEATRRGGKMTVIGVGSIKETVEFNALLLPMSGKTICGCVYGSVNPKVDFPKLLDLSRRGKLDLEGMVTNTYKIDDALQAFEDLKNGVNARGVILF